jgi:aminoglycoside phosphotransferase (APT) family kinase protein
MERFLAGDVPLPAAPSALVVSHADLKGEHLLLEPDRPRLTAIIDWADVAYLDPAVDLGSLAIWLGPDLVVDVAARSGLFDEPTVARALFQVRVWMLHGVARMLVGENDWPPDLVRTQLAWAFRAPR